MLQSMRENLKGWVAYTLVGLIIIIFALFGAEALFMGGLAQDTVAEVNGQKISELEVRRAMEMRKQQLRRMLGENIDERFLSDEFLLPSIQQSVIQQAVLLSAAESSGLRAGEKALDKTIIEDTTFHQGGKFDPDHFKSLLRQYAYTPASYRNELRKSELLTQYQQTFTATAFVTEKEIADFARLQFETRSFSYLVLPMEKAITAIQVTDGDIDAYYQQHQDHFMSETQAAVEYLLLDKKNLAANLQISEDDIKAQYEAEVAEAQDKTERHAAHILIEEKADGSHKAVLDELQKKIAAGEDFSALAKSYSADSASAVQGGDVGTTTGSSFVPEFEEALKNLSVGKVSAPVKTQFGYHIIKLLDQKAAPVPSLEESRLRIVQALKTELLEERYAEKLERLQESSKNAANLEAVANDISSDGYTAKPVQTMRFSRQNPVALLLSNPALKNPKVMDAIFAEGVHNGTVTDVIELDNANAVVIRVTEFEAAAVQPLEQVKAQVTGELRRERAAEQLNLQASALLQRLLGGESMDVIAASEKLSVQHLQKKGRLETSVNGEILKKAFAMFKVAGENSVVADTRQLENGDWALVQLVDVQVPAFELLTAEQKAQASSRLKNRAEGDEFPALLAMLTAEADIVRRKQALPAEPL